MLVRILALAGVAFLARAKVLEGVLRRCASDDDVLRCLKIQALKVTNRALNLRNISLIEGVSLVENRSAKMMRIGLRLNDSKLEKLEARELDDLLGDTSSKFFETHNLEIKIPRLLSHMVQPIDQETDEARRRKNKGGEGGGTALYWALAIKGAFLAMAYKGIAVMAGMALVMGKMALLLSAILGLKKLVNSEKETTTVEIVKKPKFSESHSYSSSYEDEGHKGYDRNDNISKTVLRTYLK